MTGSRSSFRLRPWLALLLVTAAGLLSATGCQLADLIPGHQEAELRRRVEADKFPTAAQALHAPEGKDP